VQLSQGFSRWRQQHRAIGSLTDYFSDPHKNVAVPGAHGGTRTDAAEHLSERE
jgi:hypothetical protein